MTSSLQKTIARYMSGRLLLAVGSAAAIPVLSRYLGVEGYGRLSIALALVATVVQLIGGWLQQSLLRYHAHYLTEPVLPRYTLTIQFLTFIIGGLGCIALAPLAWQGGNSPLAIVLLALLGALSLWNLVLTALAQAERRPEAIVASEAFRVFAPVALSLVFLLVGLKPQEPASLIVLVYGAGMLFACVTLTRMAGERPAHGPLAPVVVRRLWRFGAPMGLWFGLNSLQALCVLYVLKQLDATALGVYAAYNDLFIKAGTVLMMPVTYAVHAEVMARQAAGERSEALVALRQGYQYQLRLGAALLVAAVLATPLLSQVVLGMPSGYTKAGLVAVILLGVVTGNLGLLTHKGLEMTDRVGEMVGMAAVMLAVTLTVTTLLLSAGAGLWASLGLLAGNVVYCLTTHFLSRRALARG